MKIHHEKVIQKDKELVDALDFEGIKFIVSKNDLSKIEMKSKIWINVFCYENKLTYPIRILDQKFETSMNLLLEKSIFDNR